MDRTYRRKKLTKEEFTKYIPSHKADGAALITGYDNLEVVDVDLKVFSTTPEKKNLEYLYYHYCGRQFMISDKIFSIYKTKCGLSYSLQTKP